LSRLQLALCKCLTFNDLHYNVPPPLAREDKVDFGDADDAHRVGVHDPSHVSPCEALTSGDREAVFYPESRFACDLDADAVPVETSASARFDDVIEGREVFRGFHRTPDLFVCHG